MAKLSELIENFDAMDDAGKLAAMSSYEIPDQPDLSGYVKKELFDKNASEIAALKKKLAEKMTEEESAKAAEEAARAEEKARYEEVVRKLEISDNEKNLLGQGYSADHAKALAEAIADGNKEKQFEIMAKHDAEREKALREEILRKNPKPEGGKSDDNDPLIAKAVELGKATAETRKKAEDILGKYTKR